MLISVCTATSCPVSAGVAGATVAAASKSASNCCHWTVSICWVSFVLLLCSFLCSFPSAPFLCSVLFLLGAFPVFCYAPFCSANKFSYFARVHLNPQSRRKAARTCQPRRLPASKHTRTHTDIQGQPPKLTWTYRGLSYRRWKEANISQLFHFARSTRAHSGF